MAKLARGIFEDLITNSIHTALGELGTAHSPILTDLHSSEAADRFAWHLNKIIKKAIEGINQDERIRIGSDLANDLIRKVSDHATFGADDALIHSAKLLKSINKLLPDGRPEEIPSPLVPLLDSTLLTNAKGEPSLVGQYASEIPSASRIDIIMAFIRLTGINPILDKLKEFCGSGKKLRVITTTYTNSTELKALEKLMAIGADVKISYDTSTTRLHAKSWIFHRHSGFSTGFVGSSNMTHSAQVTGMEWNIRVSGARNPDIISKMDTVFESYWASPDFRRFDRDEFIRLSTPDRVNDDQITLSPLEVRLEPFQERLLELIEISRAQGHHKNLLVAATGTGKTVMAAADYGKLRISLPRARLLFIAHRKEILEKARLTFRQVIREQSFGETWVDGTHPRTFDHVFASIQSLANAELDHIDPNHFDVVIIDEVHHGAADSYRRILSHLTPMELLGLTATPERSDGLSIINEWFGGRIAAELRLWDAIDQQRLCPFNYFGIHDGTDLSTIPWRRGRGYDTDELSKLYTADDHWANLVLKQLKDHVADLRKVRCLGFCVSVDHAKFMSKIFKTYGLNSVAVWGDSPRDERVRALKGLEKGDIQFLFSVDLFNEGIDIPSVDTLLMLRPTDSPTLFLQQLGRGLRKHPRKPICTVLDFVGNHNSEFQLENKFLAIAGGARSELEGKIKEGFPFLPTGCNIILDQRTATEVLRSIKESIPSQRRKIVAEVKAMSARSPNISLQTFLADTGIELRNIYKNGCSWSDILQESGAKTLPAGPHEGILRKAISRITHIDDNTRIQYYLQILADRKPPNLNGLSEINKRLVRMLITQITHSAIDGSTTLEQAVELMWGHPQVIHELCELFTCLSSKIDHLHSNLPNLAHVPVRVHAKYERSEILAAFGLGSEARAPSWREGVKWADGEKTDIFAFTLDKTSGRFSPTTRYRDYAVSTDLFHWESQNDTSSVTTVGRRYVNHVRNGSHVVLFAQMQKGDAYWCLGTAKYVSHTAEKPMAITWKLDLPLPGDLYYSFAAMVG